MQLIRLPTAVITSFESHKSDDFLTWKLLRPFSACSQFGEVWKSRHRKTGKLLAIKKILPGAAMTDLTKEIAIMKRCVSPYVVRYYGNYYHEGLLWVRVHETIAPMTLTGQA